jgi:hypothetical protein
MEAFGHQLGKIGNSCMLLACIQTSLEHTTLSCQQATNAGQVKEDLHLCSILAVADEPQLEALIACKHSRALYDPYNGT